MHHRLSHLRCGLQGFRIHPEHERVVGEQEHLLSEEADAVHARVLQLAPGQQGRQRS